MIIVFKNGKELEVPELIVDRIFSQNITANAANNFQVFKPSEEHSVQFVINVNEISFVKPK